MGSCMVKLYIVDNRAGFGYSNSTHCINFMGTGVSSKSDKPVPVPYYDAHIGPFYINIRRYWILRINVC